MLPASGDIDHATLVFAAFVTVAVNCTDSPALMLTAVVFSVMVIGGGGVGFVFGATVPACRKITVVSDTSGYPAAFAVNVTTAFDLIVFGAV